MQSKFDEETALKVSEHILDTMERLESFHDSGSLSPDEWLNQKEYQMIICKKHVIIYRWISEGVYIYHIADTQTEYTKVF